MSKYPLMTIGFDLNIVGGHANDASAGFGRACMTFSKGQRRKCYAWMQLPVQVFHMNFTLRDTDHYHFMQMHRRR